MAEPKNTIKESQQLKKVLYNITVTETITLNENEAIGLKINFYKGNKGHEFYNISLLQGQPADINKKHTATEIIRMENKYQENYDIYTKKGTLKGKLIETLENDYPGIIGQIENHAKITIKEFINNLLETAKKDYITISNKEKEKLQAEILSNTETANKYQLKTYLTDYYKTGTHIELALCLIQEKHDYLFLITKPDNKYYELMKDNDINVDELENKRYEIHDKIIDLTGYTSTPGLIEFVIDELKKIVSGEIKEVKDHDDEKIIKQIIKDYELKEQENINLSKKQDTTPVKELETDYNKPLSLPDAMGTLLKQEQYQEQLKQIKEHKKTILNINYQDLNEILVKNNLEHLFKTKLEDIIRAIEKKAKNDDIETIIDKAETIKNLREYTAKDINSTVSTIGTIKSITDIKPVIKEGVYSCLGCEKLIGIKNTNLLPNSEPTKPKVCTDCGGKTFKLEDDLCIYINVIYSQIEEPLELKKGSSSRVFEAIIKGDIIDTDKPLDIGDTVHILGVLKTIQRKEGRNFIIDVNNLKSDNASLEDLEISKEDKDYFKKLSERKDILELFRDSILPNVYGHNEIKEGLTLQLFSGEPKTNIQEQNDKTGINILWVGDPGLAKSESSRRLAKINPKAVYINSLQTTAPGLIGSVSQDDFSKSWTYQMGSIAQTNQGLLIMDEIDKNKDLIKHLYEPMEQGTISLSKAGTRINSLNYNVNIKVLAIGNPKNTNFNEYDNLFKQVKIIDNAGISRFDLIYATQDKPNIDDDLKIAKTMLQGTNETENLLDEITIKKYVSYSKTIKPSISDKANEYLTNKYKDIRQAGSINEDNKPITPRDLNSIKKLTLAIARLKLNEIAEIEDSKEAIRIYTNSLKTIDLTIETAGTIENVKSPKEQKIMKKLKDEIIDLHEDHENISWYRKDKMLDKIVDLLDIDKGEAKKFYDECKPIQ